jgi:protoheme IX farnesyltransferase
MSTAISFKRVANRRAYFWKEWAILLLSLGKIKISLLVTLTTATGYLLAAEGVTIRMLVPAAAVFLLAFGSCALNQYQERKIDAFMERTKNRPLPSGRLNPNSALFISLGLISAGSFTLFYGANFLTGILGGLAIFWYNGVYTYLKQKTAFAAIPGALVGMIPPILGWVSGGGNLLDSRIGAVAFFFFIWQVPHFWLLLLDRGADYEKAGFPSLAQIFTPMQLRRITFIWILAAAVACMTIPLFGLVRSHVINGSLFAIGFWLVWKTFRILTTQCQEFPFQLNFKTINIYVFSVIFLFAMDKLIQTH